jgi:uncharacterized protein YkwD/uncharacterized membrane protein required for colicin V production
MNCHPLFEIQTKSFCRALSSMNYVDLILIIVIGLAVFQGWSRGFIDSFIEIVILIGSFISAFFLWEPAAKLLDQLFKQSDFWTGPLSFILILIFASSIISAFFNKLRSGIKKETLQHPVNKIAGIIPGFLKGVLYALILSFFLISYPLGKFTQKVEQSHIAISLTRKPAWLPDKISSLLNDPRFNAGSITIHPKTKELIKLPFKTNDLRVRKDLEIRMLHLINRERKKEGLKELIFDEELARVARSHSKDMFNRGYFSHYTPEGLSPFDRIRKEKIRFLIAGENLALAQNLELAHRGLMESPGHRANILHKAFGRVGIGIQDGGIYGIMVTQNFRN